MLKRLVIVAAFWVAAVAPTHATSVLPLQLDQLVADAQLVFQGTCTANQSQYDSQTGLIVTYTTFMVQDVLKGRAGHSHTIKQAGGRIGSANYRIMGVPSFVLGQEYVVFLYGVSQAGFSSPVGLGQGQFVVTLGVAGRELSNGRDFNALIPAGPGAAMVSSARSDGEARGIGGTVRHLGLDDFKLIVRQRVGGAQ